MDAIELVILVGIQGSGKTTFYRRRMAEEYLHISLDRWRGKGGARSKERRAILDGLEQAAGSQARGVVVDNTNVTAEGRRRYFEYADDFARRTGRGVRVIACFFDADLEGCLARNAARPLKPPVGTPYFVPPGAIVAFHRRLQPPRLAEGFQAVRRVRIGAEGEFLVDEP